MSKKRKLKKFLKKFIKSSNIGQQDEPPVRQVVSKSSSENQLISRDERDFIEYGTMSYYERKAKDESCYLYDVIHREEWNIVCADNSSFRAESFKRTSVVRPGLVYSFISDIHLEDKYRTSYYKGISNRNNWVLGGEIREILIIAGDIIGGSNVKPSISAFERFVSLLGDLIGNWVCKSVVFVLGNHEIGALDATFDDLVTTYRNIIERYDNFYLLQNDLLYCNAGSKDVRLNRISESDLQSLSVNEIKLKLQYADGIIFGGVGFSGLRDAWSAMQNIYFGSMTVAEEDVARDKFNVLYDKVCECCDEAVIVTHMPVYAWKNGSTSDICLKKGFVYINGHDHRNGCQKIDESFVYKNCVGYVSSIRSVRPKHIAKSCAKINIFAGYADGIYNITLDDYNKFLYFMFDYCQFHNIAFNSEKLQITMLKRNSVYLFLYKSASSFGILCKSEPVRLSNLGYYYRNVNYYYDRMCDVASDILKVWNIFVVMRNKISCLVDTFVKERHVDSSGTSVRKGKSYAHGCIVDIDACSHIFVWPTGDIITPYYSESSAYDDIKIFGSVISLLKSHCMYMYKDMTQDQIQAVESTNSIVFSKNDCLRGYQAANKRMLKIEELSKSGILGYWAEYNPKLEESFSKEYLKDMSK